MREPKRGVAERGAELEHAPRIGRGGKRAEQRSVGIGIGAATVLGAMRERRLAHGGEGVGG